LIAIVAIVVFFIHATISHIIALIETLRLRKHLKVNRYSSWELITKSFAVVGGSNILPYFKYIYSDMDDDDSSIRKLKNGIRKHIKRSLISIIFIFVLLSIIFISLLISY